MNSSAVNVAAKLVTEIPLSKLPKTLQKRILLPSIGKIEVMHKNQSKLYITTVAFVNNYAPSIKYYNEHLDFQRRIVPEQITPVIAVYDKSNNLIEKIDSGSIPHHSELLDKLLKINNAITPSLPGSITDLIAAAEPILKQQQSQQQQA